MERMAKRMDDMAEQAEMEVGVPSWGRPPAGLDAWSLFVSLNPAPVAKRRGWDAPAPGLAIARRQAVALASHVPGPWEPPSLLRPP